MTIVNKVVNIPYGENVSYLKKMIAEAYDISLSEFQLFVNMKPLGEDDDDTLIREIGFSVVYVIRKIKDERGDIHPKTLLVGNQEFFHLLFDLMSHDEDYDVENIWKLLMKLPQDEVQAAKKLESLDIESESEWEELIDGSSLHKLLYSLQIINKSLQANSEWQNKFLVMRGFHHMFNTFLKIDASKINSTLAFKSVDILCRILCESMQENPDLMNHFREHSLESIDQLIRLIHQVAIYSIQDLKKRGVSYDDLYYKNKQSEQKNFRLMSYYGDKSKSENEQEDQNQYGRQISALNAKFDLIGKFVSLAFRLLFHFEAYNNEDCISRVNDYPKLTELLQNTLFETDNFYIRDQFGDGLKDMLCNQTHDLEKFVEFKKNVLNILTYKVKEQTEKYPTRTYKCTDILYGILSTTSQNQLSKMGIDFEEVIDINVKIIIEKDSIEKTTSDYDTVLFGAFRMVKVLIQQFPYLKEKYGDALLLFLLKDCLFEVPKASKSRKKIRPPKCKNSGTRNAVFSLINVLCRDSLENLQKVLSFLRILQEKSQWRTKIQHDWMISPYTDEKSPTGFVGIKNLGCICYMISLMQQLYMIPSFRESILAVDDPKKNETPKEDNVLYQFQCIFAHLLLSEQQYYNPQGFTNAFKDWDGNPTNVLIQMDVDEFFNMFMDRLEFAIKGTPQEKMIQDHFGGTYANELICKGCPHYSERSEPYLAVNLQVKNKKSIKEGLDALIEGEMLDGDNSYYCEKCDKKVPTLKRTCIKRLPKHLILVLKRFEFDYDYMQKMKVNDYCEFPEELNMEPYTQEGLARREKMAKKEENPNEDDEEGTVEPKYPLDLYNYKLSGVLVHSGYAEGGHYYSFIKDREDEEGEDKWYEFNDEIVKEFDKEDLESECFGGEEKWNDMMGHSIYLKNTEKHRNAYVLFYERIADEEIPYSDDEDESTQNNQVKDGNDESDAQMVSEQADEVSDPKLQRANTMTVKIPDEIADMVEEENRKYWQYRFMFSQEYSEFILELCSLWNTKHMVLLNYDTRNRDYHICGVDETKYKEELKAMPNSTSMHYSANKNIKCYPEKFLLPNESIDIYQKYGGEKVDLFEFEIFKLAATFYLTVKQRASIKENIPEILDLIKAHLNKSMKACKWLIMQFSNEKVLTENLLQCPIADMRKLSAGLVYCAMLRIYEEEKEYLDSYWQFKAGTKESLTRCYIGNFINLLIANMNSARTYTEYNPQYFSLLSRFARLGQEARVYLLKAKMVGRVLNYYLQDSSPFQDYFKDTSDLNYEENEQVDLGLPTDVDKAHISIWEEMFMKKRDAQIADAQQDYTFLWEVLSLCLRSCVLSSPDSETFVDDLRYQDLHEYETSLLKLDEKDLMGLVESSSTKLAAHHMGSILLHMCQNNIQLDTGLRNILVAGINDKQLDELKPYFPIFKRYLEIQDDHTEERIADSLREYFGILKNNAKFGSFMAKFTGFMVKLCNRNRGVAEFLASCAEEWEWVIEWIRKTPCPGKDNRKYNYAREAANSQYKLKRLEEIRDGKIQTFENEYDSDDSMYDYKFYKGMKLDIHHAGQAWVTAEVNTSLDEMMNVHYTIYNNQKAPWLSIDSEDIAPHLEMQHRHDLILIEENRTKLEEQFRANMQQREESGSNHGMSESVNNYSNEGNEPLEAHDIDSVSD
jgi:ubiquitin carboxyl-terminal hydrolase 9/24